ncbi:MAG: type IV pilin N-terminal domain-containing protein [Methanospirillaceae archaeon]|nr:type IV pilin N-terminal domain-containing protein [Methanospirillaceae archaeon]
MKRKDDAVSPVVGVLLMLVVCLIIAAVVSGFAGGLAGGTEAPPSASLDVDIYSSINAGAMPPWGDGYYVPDLVIKHLSGDTLPTKDLEIKTYFTNSTGTYKGGVSSEETVAGDAAWTSFSASEYCGVLYLNDQNRFGDDTIQDSDTGNDNWFGNVSATLRPGDIMLTPGNFCGNYDDNDLPSAPHKNPGMDELFGVECSASYTEFKPGSIARIIILHKPSGKAIYDKEVVIQ